MNDRVQQLRSTSPREETNGYPEAYPKNIQLLDLRGVFVHPRESLWPPRLLFAALVAAVLLRRE
jgi:hypothetical protein